MFFSSGYLFIMVVALVLGAATQAFVTMSYRRYAGEALYSGLTGADIARRMLDSNGLQHVGIEMVGGRLTDHYDPRDQVLRLSEDVYRGRHVAAAGVAAHEAGHAVQHALRFAPAALRQTLVPAANIGSQAAWPLVMLGLFLGAASGVGSFMIQLGVFAFAAAVLFQLVTLPVEFDASRRALVALPTTGALAPDQIGGARRVLTAAALTYIAATLVSIMQLVYFLGLSRRD